MAEQLLTAAMVAAHMNKTNLWDDAKLDAVQADIDAAASELEDELNALLFRRQIVQSVEPLPWSFGYRRINVRGPIVRIESLTRDSDGTDVQWFLPGQIGEEDSDCIFISGINNSNEGNTYTLAYTGGPLIAPSTAVSLVQDVITRKAIVGLSVASGALSTYSVEGMSIGLGAASAKSDPNSKGSFSASELGSLARLRRRVVQ